MDDVGANTEKGSRATKANPRDGLIDFTAYSIEQLRDLRHSIDPDAFPENFKHLLAALEQKEQLIAQPPVSCDPVAGKFTSRNGLLGWIQAGFSRSLVYGIGSLEVGPTDVVLSGWQRTWLGVPLETQVTRDLTNVRNVVHDGTQVRFEIARKYCPANRICFQPESPEDASRLLAKLPGITTTGFLARWSAIREFNAKLRVTGGRPLVTPVVVGLNVLVFAAMAFSTKKLGQFTPQELLNWGANFGPLTVNGQWWRLFTALFVHFSLLHVLLNMWALWNVGSLTERLFGRGTLLFLYVAAGVLASLTSIAWDPSHSSVGASGAIFGIFGAFRISKRTTPPNTAPASFVSIGLARQHSCCSILPTAQSSRVSTMRHTWGLASASLSASFGTAPRPRVRRQLSRSVGVGSHSIHFDSHFGRYLAS